MAKQTLQDVKDERDRAMRAYIELWDRVNLLNFDVDSLKLDRLLDNYRMDRIHFVRRLNEEKAW